jgi:nitroreductase
MTVDKLIPALNWRYATKAFDSTKKLSEEQLEILLSAVQLAPTSYGLQPFKIIVISDQDVKDKLKAAAYEQVQVAQASQVFVFAIHKNYTTTHVDAYAKDIVETRGVTLEDIKGFVDTMKGTVISRTQEQLANWNARQAYISLGFLLETAALNDIDACPMEGFDNAKFDEILGLDSMNLTSVVMATVGFRSDEDKYQFAKKVRKSKEDLFVML